MIKQDVIQELCKICDWCGDYPITGLERSSYKNLEIYKNAGSTYLKVSYDTELVLKSILDACTWTRIRNIEERAYMAASVDTKEFKMQIGSKIRTLKIDELLTNL